MNLKKIGKVFTSKFVRTGPSSYKKRIYRAAVSQSLRNTELESLDSFSVPLSVLHCLVYSFTLMTEAACRPRVFENRVLKRIFGPNRDEVTGDWRKLHNEELNDLCCSPNIV